MPQNYLMLLWHMHQPFYKDLVEGTYAMPWVRLHALKDYYGMAAILREFPSVHVTFNLVPSLVAQLQDYASQNAQEEALRVAFEPAVQLTPEDKERLLADAFQLNHENLLSRYPRYRELYEKTKGVSAAKASRLLTTQEVVDLQLLSQLAWFDETYLAKDDTIRNLATKARSYTEDDKRLIFNKEHELLNAVLKEYREASARGQAEISTSPFYHPILPLLCDSDAGAESHPGLKLPSRRFRHPEDARDQLRAAIELHEKVFGSRPRGFWPSEGSLSDSVLQIASEEGFDWAATDEGVLGRSLQMGFPRHGDGTVGGGHELYRPHRFLGADRPVSILFRDHQLSDLIGFVYSHMDPHAAAGDLHHRIRAAARSTGERPAVVSVILDGENAWEFYAGNGREFLKAFYGRLASDPELRAVTASEALGVTEQGSLRHLVPGSWISANFDVWIGADEDNRAWDLLSQARDFFDRHSAKPGLTPGEVNLARQELWIAEGSDWCWWYGPEHSTPLEEEFDLLYRKHLSNIYRLLGSSPPDELAVPIKRPRTTGVSVAPTDHIQPTIDGRLTNYFEWLGSGVYSPENTSGSMHAASSAVEALYYGSNEQSVYLRLDLTEPFLKDHFEFEIRVNAESDSVVRLHAKVADGRLRGAELWQDENNLANPQDPRFEAAFARIFELRLDYCLLDRSSRKPVRFRLSLWAGSLPLQTLPPAGWFTLDRTEKLEPW